MNIINFRGELTDSSAKKEALVVILSAFGLAKIAGASVHLYDIHK